MSPDEYISRLLHQFKNNAINANELALIDGVLYVSETHIRSIAPLEEPRLMETGLLIFLYGQEASMKNSAFRAMTGNGMFS